LKLHDDTLKRTHGWRNLEQLKDDRLIAAKTVAGCDPEKKCIADISGSAGDRNADWIPHGFSLCVPELGFMKIAELNQSLDEPDQDVVDDSKSQGVPRTGEGAWL